MTETPGKRPFLPPRWFIHGAWITHRALLRATGGRIGLRQPSADAYGMLRLTTVGRRSRQPREAILAYVEDGADIIVVAMNGWGAPEPAWWLNLQAQPEATVVMPGGEGRAVRARVADPQERARLLETFRPVWKDFDRYSALRPTETAIVILEPGATPASS